MRLFSRYVSMLTAALSACPPRGWRRLVGPGLLTAALSACSTPSKQPPLPALGTEAGSPLPTTPGLVRTVTHRSPFGNIVQADNLMLDGDFELTGRTGQAPWLAFNQTQQTLNYATGGRCHSGVRCAVMGPGDSLVGLLSSPATSGLTLRVYVLPEGGSCGDVSVSVFDLDANQSGGSLATPASAAADGWCVFQGSASSVTYGEPALFLTLKKGAASMSVRVDEATALPTGEMLANGIRVATEKPPGYVLDLQDAAARWIHAHRRVK